MSHLHKYPFPETLFSFCHPSVNLSSLRFKHSKSSWGFVLPFIDIDSTVFSQFLTNEFPGPFHSISSHLHLLDKGF